MKVCVESIGCKVNYYEAEAIKNILFKNGHQISNDNFDVYILNSCALTTAASSKSRQKIRSIKRNYPMVWTILTGCLAQEAQNNALTWGIDLVVGNEFKKDMDKIIRDINTRRCVVSSNIRTQCIYTAPSLSGSFSRKRAYVMVQDGCDNYCRYCKIPYLRGRTRSRSIEDISLEIRQVKLSGFQELVIVGINIGSYKYNNINLIKLLERIIKSEEIERIRLSSIEPQYITDEFIEFLSYHQNYICNHLHIPLQSGDDNILRLMGRRYTTSFYASIIERLRKIINNLAVTTDIIVGFPSEEEDNFLNTYEFIKKIKFSKIHVFRYSDNLFTRGELSRLKPVSECVKKERAMQIAKLSQELSLEYRRSFEGKEVEVLVEEIKGDILQGTTREYIKVFIDTKDTKKTFLPYTLVKAKIKYIDAENTYAEIINK